MAPTAIVDDKIRSLRKQIANAQSELDSLRKHLHQAEHEAGIQAPDGAVHVKPLEKVDNTQDTPNQNTTGRTAIGWPMPLEDYKRYGRQMIMPEIGLAGQLCLRTARVLVVGVGGLGCPAAAYLAGAGVGRIGLVDGDVVEVSNLHRQILHRTKNVGMSKVDSAIQYLHELNPTIEYTPHREHLSSENALGMCSQYDLILDCTDHPTSRYLISDACVLLCKPLVSASALRTEGQLMVLNNHPLPQGDMSGSPCYRCIFPTPPPAESVTSCGEGGVLGPVVGVMGVLQALEAIKILTTTSPEEPATGESIKHTRPAGKSKSSLPSLLLFSAYSSPPFRSVRLRPRKSDCAACSSNATITKESLSSGSFDYIQFCGVVNPVQLLGEGERVSPSAYEKLRTEEQQEHVLVDVREKAQFTICSLPGSVNVPFSSLRARLPSLEQYHAGSKGEDEAVDWLATLHPSTPIYVVCRLGNDSQVTVRQLKDAGWDQSGDRFIGDIRGGFKAWKDEVDGNWPEY
ncbi:MAG: Urmylation protein [Sclerophora amabilis]|nr:MAG: Urmylation protein [Sclerophora amabilis]